MFLGLIFLPIMSFNHDSASEDNGLQLSISSSKIFK